MAGIGRTVLTLRFFGDDLDPAELTERLGVEPTTACRKGEWAPSGRPVAKGAWRLAVDDREPGDLEGQISELFGRLTDDLKVWLDLTARYQADLFCGLFMDEANEGLTLKPATLAAISSRGLDIGFDIYNPADD